MIILIFSNRCLSSITYKIMINFLYQPEFEYGAYLIIWSFGLCPWRENIKWHEAPFIYAVFELLDYKNNYMVIKNPWMLYNANRLCVAWTSSRHDTESKSSTGHASSSLERCACLSANALLFAFSKLMARRSCYWLRWTWWRSSALN